jgi:hypothetical protein
VLLAMLEPVTGYYIRRWAALIRFYPKSAFEPPGLSQSSFQELDTFPVFRTTSATCARNQCFRLAAQDVRFRPIVVVRP